LLSIEIFQLSGGMVTLANRAAGGARVTLRLPLKFGASRSRPRLILLVEDNSEIRETVRAMLRELGHSILEATSADEAEALAAVPGIDTVLTDITLDGSRTGLDLARSLTRQNSTAQVFMMTSLPASDKTRQAARSEYPLIGKPFTLPQLSDFLAKGGLT